MARSRRVFIKNACYHIIARGIRKEKIFLDDRDYERYLIILRKYKVNFGCHIYCYCLMPNHIHIVLESPKGLKAMSGFMHNLNQTYAMFYNYKYGKVGHLWQNRYKSCVVLKDKYLLNLTSYIEYNPVRAKIVDEPEKYKWSTYRARILGENNYIVDNIDKFYAGTGLG